VWEGIYEDKQMFRIKYIIYGKACVISDIVLGSNNPVINICDSRSSKYSGGRMNLYNKTKGERNG